MELFALAGAALSSAASSTATVVSGIGTALSVGGTVAAGMQAKSAADFQAKQLEQKAQETRAAGQRETMKDRLKTDNVLSSLQARAASSGGTATDPTVIDLAENIEGRGEYQALMSAYKGENAARGLEDAAAGKRAEGDAAEFGGYLKGAGIAFSGGSSMYKKYGYG